MGKRGIIPSHPAAARAGSGVAGGAVPADHKRYAELFDKYKEADDVISSEGIQKICSDIGISALDPVTLALAHQCEAAHMGVFTREEFIRGMAALGCHSSEDLKAKLPQLRGRLDEKRTCKEIYGFTFKFALDEGQRTLPLEICVELWKLLLCNHFALLDAWLEFAQVKCPQMVSQDLWMMLWDLAAEVKPDLSNYEDDSSWPVLLDEFVEYVRAKKT
eukprot:TRINITY_DN98438_c0_g1_i1.p1 TRINITY_DN98438_c0_g1~~TRINITY_DN98438_c0_g1_i1.p1  ORF type:complete len:227 (-),score=50.16 TRINITY_DN98438_c0_g1_i1:33-686(-)